MIKRKEPKIFMICQPVNEQMSNVFENILSLRVLVFDKILKLSNWKIFKLLSSLCSMHTAHSAPKY